jgi:hypothetical protein
MGAESGSPPAITCRTSSPLQNASDHQAPRAGRRSVAHALLKFGIHLVGQRVSGLGTLKCDDPDVVIETPPYVGHRRAPMNMFFSAS